MQRFHVSRCKAHLDFVYELEAKNLLLVVGEYIWQQEVIPPKAQWQFAVDNVRALGEYAVTLGLEIAIELEPFKLSFVNSSDKMVQFLKDVDHPAVRANLDISHLALSNSPAESIPNLKRAYCPCALLRLRRQGPRRFASGAGGCELHPLPPAAQESGL